MKTRLDVVVQVKERAEDKAGVELAQAERAVTAAKSRFESARATASMDFRSRSDISQWEVTELAHHRALSDANKARREFEELQKAATMKRSDWLAMHRAAEVVRRVAENRKHEWLVEESRQEDKVLDEAASLLFFRKAS
ncbi:MAG: flagellar FliJ family protein [Myxococcaceae bacterium]